MSAPAVLLQGIDLGDTGYWSWEWRDGRVPGGMRRIPLERLAPTIDELDDALPGIRPHELELGVAALREQLTAAPAAAQAEAEQRAGLARVIDAPVAEAAALRPYVAVHRCLSGAFSRPDTELALMRRVAGALELEELLAEIVDAGSAGDPVRVAVLPAQSCARVPWELLPIEPDGVRRLLDVAEVVTVAPVTARATDDQAATRGDRRIGVRIIDPHVPRVAGTQSGEIVTKTSRDAWHARGGSLLLQEPVDRLWLSDELIAGASHFTFVGHVETGIDKAGRPEPALTSLVLGESDRVWASSPARGHLRTFSAQDAVRGTVGYVVEDDAFPLVPVGARSGTTVQQVPGRALWPMPRRVAIIACESGGDFRDVEPFGLVTAMLELGAESVTATRWILHTDHAFGLYQEGAAPLNTAALDVDELQDPDAHADIAAALTDWKRGRLEAWRHDKDLAASPLTWAAFTVHRTPRPAGGAEAAA